MDISADLLSSLIFAVVQGFTEWFPVSSDGHLVIASRLLGFQSNFLFDVALHFGTLMAVFVFFGKDITEIMKDIFSLRWKTPSGKLGLMIVVGTIPVAIFGFLLRDIVEDSFSSLTVTALGFGLTAMVLFIAVVYRPKKEKILGSMNYRDALLIGFVQISALLPGVSRSATTLSVALLLGYVIKDAAKFSFLLSIPAVFGANVLVVGNNALPQNLIWATLLAFVVGLLAIFLLFRYAFNKKENLKWFAIYALILAAIVGIWGLFLS